MKRALVAIALLIASASPAHAEPYRTAVLQDMDKVTARVTTLRVEIGQSVRFGTLEVIARHCDKRPPEDLPESAAFLDVWEVRPGEAAVALFRGWMFASSPGLNALEHPVYDVWVLDCENMISNSEETMSPNAPSVEDAPGN